MSSPVAAPLKVSAREAAESARNMLKLNNDSRYVPPMLPLVQDVSQRNKVYIFNVGPWAQERLLGSCGSYRIQPCPEGKEYSSPVEIPGIVSDLYPINEGEYKRLDSDGYEFAMQVLGVGPMLSPRNSFVPFGVFVSRSNPPKEEEVKTAKRALREKFLELINEADMAYANGPKAVEETIRPETHFVAARALKKSEAECPWLRNSAVPAERSECASCGAVYKVGIMKCACGFILDKKKYDQAVKDGLFAA